MKILIVDDERAIRYSLKEILEMEGYAVETAENGLEGLEKARKEKYDAIFCDIKMPQMDGTEMLSKVIEEGIETPVVMVSGHADISTAVDCIKRGAFDFIEKPLDLNRILITLKNATDKASLVKETKILKKKIYGREMVGESQPIGHLKDMIQKVAPTQASVLITGPNGSGKELVAQSIYQLSPRSMMPFVEVNCAAIPSELIDSELFGHKKGSFTSAIKDHKGKFEQADGGTIFLDEIGDMSLAAQAKVLRVLQERKLTPVGGDKEITVDVRRHQQEPAGRDWKGQFPGRPLPPPQRDCAQGARPGREEGGHPAADRALLQDDFLRKRKARAGVRARRHDASERAFLARKHKRTAQCRGAPPHSRRQSRHCAGCERLRVLTTSRAGRRNGRWCSR